MIAWSFLSSVSPEGHFSHCFLAVGGPCESACGLIGSIFNTFQSFYELLSLIWVFFSVFWPSWVYLWSFCISLFCVFFVDDILKYFFMILPLASQQFPWPPLCHLV